jgi:hypothetical protein
MLKESDDDNVMMLNCNSMATVDSKATFIEWRAGDLYIIWGCGNG